MKARELVTSVCKFCEIRDFIETHHYSKNVNGVKVSHCFRVDFQNRLIGAVLFGCMSTTAWKKFGSTEREILELRRLVLLDEAERNSESRVVGFTLRWIKRNDPKIRTIVSYADPAYGHTGVIYKASNFKYIGISAKDKYFRDPSNGKTYHSRALRTKGDSGDYKPFVKVLRDKLFFGFLEPIELPGKHCYIFKL